MKIIEKFKKFTNKIKKSLKKCKAEKKNWT